MLEGINTVFGILIQTDIIPWLKWRSYWEGCRKEANQRQGKKKQNMKYNKCLERLVTFGILRLFFCCICILIAICFFSKWREFSAVVLNQNIGFFFPEIPGVNYIDCCFDSCFSFLLRPGVSDYQFVVRPQLALGHRCWPEKDGQQNLRRLRD